MSQSNPSPLRPFACTCTICRTLNGTRAGLATVPVHEMNSTRAEANAVSLIIEAERLLHAAQSVLQQQHTSLQHHNRPAGSLPSPHSSSSQQRNAPPNNVVDGAPRFAASETTSTRSSPTHVRQLTNPWERTSPVSPAKSDKSSDFKEVLRARAAELGILRVSTDVGSHTGPHQSNHPPTPTSQRMKFLVCDHCRSHGLRCNEASVCKECILREMPCTHRMCELSPESKEGCPRQICFYVHADWMPDVYGGHNPTDSNWLILPGKVREHLSAGQLGRLPHKSEEETLRCYQGVSQRQARAKADLTQLVQAGIANWETVGMACKCVEIEMEEQHTRTVEERLRRLCVARKGDADV